jgi:hypothetical protein
MKKFWGFLNIGIVALFAGLAGISPLAVQGQPSPASGGGELDRLESGIRSASPRPAPVLISTGQHAYLGAFADDDAGHGVRVLSVHAGGPADQAGVHPQDLVVAAAGRKIRLLSELSTILNHLNPGDRLPLELLRGNQPLHVVALLAAVPGAAPAGQTAPPPLPMPLPGSGAARTESIIPPPPGDVVPPSVPTIPTVPEGPTLVLPGPPAVPPNNSQAQIDELRRRVEELEQKVQALERALAERPKKLP